jgi:uncharacterized protein (DUF362 family)
MRRNLVSVFRCHSYDSEETSSALRAVLAPLFLEQDNPLAELVKKGDTVLIKPNWIRESHELRPEEWESILSHPCILTGLLSLAARALQGDGRVIIADSPSTNSSFDKILQYMPVEKWHRIAREYRVDLQILDLRDDLWIAEDGIIVERRPLAGDPMGSLTFDLGHASAFSRKELPPLGYCGADYKSDETKIAHSGGQNLYRVSRSAIESDVFINMPKLKTHRKAGITASMKNLVGINTYKNFLPHYADGTPEQGGDAFPRHSSMAIAERAIVSRLKRLWVSYPSTAKFFVPIKPFGNWIFGDSSRVIRSGNWYGNDTLWRTILDLNRILLHGNADGTMRHTGIKRTKKYLTVIDGVVAGEGNGPVSPDRVKSDILLAGLNPVAVDCVAAKIMGFDYLKVPYLRESFSIQDFPLVDFNYNEITVISDNDQWNKPLNDIATESVFRFKPSPGWKGHIELEIPLRWNVTKEKQKLQ